MKRLPLLKLSSLLLASAVMLHAADYYVSTNGNDGDTGTLRAPFLTIERAFDQSAPGDTIFLRKGIYRENVALTRKSGKAGSPIILTAYNGENAVISGLDVLKLKWQATSQSGIYVATFETDTVSQLFYNGKPMLEARWPNVPRDENGDWNFFSPDVWAAVDPEGNDYGTVADSRLAATGMAVTGAQAMLNVAHQYFSWTRKVQNHSAGAKSFNYTKDLGESVSVKDETGHDLQFQDDRYYLFGLRQFLDAPGEWFYDKTNHQLYVYSPDGKSPSAGSLEIKTRDWGFTADQNSNYLTIDGIQFFATAFKFGKSYQAKSSHIVVRNNSFLYSSCSEYVGMPKGPGSEADTVYPSIDADDAQVVNNTFAFGSLGALYVNGFDNLIENNVFHDFCYNSSLSCPTLQVSKAWPAIIGKAGRATIRYNTFSRSGGIQVQLAQVDNDFQLNDVADSFLACFGGNKDTSAVYTQNVFCSGTRIHHNWVHGGYSGTPPLKWGGGMGIRGDDKTAGLTVDHNVTWDLGAAGIEIKSPDNPTQKQANLCVNNTVFKHSEYIKQKGAILIPSIIKDQNIHSTVANNLSDSIYGWWNNKPLGQLMLFSNNTSHFDPAQDLVNAAWFDFRPASSAAAIMDGGVVVAGLTGKMIGKAPDIGAYERGDSVYWIPGRREKKASFPIVPDKAFKVPTSCDVLMWRPAYQAVAHTVYFSTELTQVQSGSSQAFEGKLEGDANVFTLPLLAGGQTYYWRVDATMPDKSVARGDVWSFTTN